MQTEAAGRLSSFFRIILWLANLNNGVGQSAFRAATGADDTAFQAGARGNLCAGPKDRILDHRIGADRDSRDRTTSSQGLARWDRQLASGGESGCGQSCRLHVSGPPGLLRNGAMDREIVGARTEIEPAAFLDNHAADSCHPRRSNRPGPERRKSSRLMKSVRKSARFQTETLA